MNTNRSGKKREGEAGGIMKPITCVQTSFGWGGGGGGIPVGTILRNTSVAAAFWCESWYIV